MAVILTRCNRCCIPLFDVYTEHMNTQHKKPMVRYHVVLPAETIKRMHEHKDRTGVPTAEFVRRAIEAALVHANKGNK